jgi:hypothetical protein
MDKTHKVPIDPDLVSFQAKRTGKDRTAFSDHAERIRNARSERYAALKKVAGD